jgi:hypothetical protein
MEENDNVVRLFPRLSTQLTDIEDESSDVQMLDVPDDRFRIKKPILLVGRDDRPMSSDAPITFPFNRIAVDLFGRTDSWFMVNIQDLNPESFQSAHALRSLGRMCIFVSDLSAVSIEHQLRIAEAFGAIDETGDHPCLIAAVHEDPEFLVQQGRVLPVLLELMTAFEVPASRTSKPGLKRLTDEIEATLTGAPISNRTSNLIPLLGNWRSDSNPTFH